MSYRKMNGFTRLITVVAVLVFVLTLIIGLTSFLSGSNEKKVSNEKVAEENISVQQNEEEPVEQTQSDGSDNAVKYMTISQNGNIDIFVNYLNPSIGSKDVLTFEVSLGTHSVSLSKYKDIRKYVELVTDTEIVVSEGFEWELQNAEDHHISGLLKIKNDIDGKSIVREDTKSFKLVFKNIPDTSEREHIYEGEKLK
ncbi:MAG: hypothetical protein AB7V16_10905 [Vulcanibacillus sp.]